jgi:hypothetical protein
MSSSALQIAKDELLSISDFQADMHILNDSNNGEIISPFYKKYIKSTWRSHVVTKFASKIDSNDIIYPVNNSFHYLEYTYLTFKLPAIRVKRGKDDKWVGNVRIAWCHDVGNNIRQRATFKEDDDEYQTIDNVWGDIYPQFYQDPGAGKRDAHNFGTGITSHLEKWSEDYLPPFDVNVNQPWFYTLDLASAFPIWMKNSQTKAAHRYTYRRKVTNLLRLEIKNSKGIWEPQKKNINKYIDIIGPKIIRTPQLWGRYAYVSNDELDWNNKCDDDTWVVIDADKNIREKVLYTRDVVCCDIENPIKYKSSSDKIISCASPCLAFFWVAENISATAIHNYSNYTTNTHNIYDGWDPIKKTTFTIGKSKIFNKMDSHHFSIAQPRKHFPSSPWIAGYHGYSIAQDSTNFNGDISLVFDELKASMNCLLDNNDIYINKYKTEDDNIDDDDDEDDDETDLDMSDHDDKISDNKLSDISSPNFIVRTRLLVIRKFTITSGQSNGNMIYSFDIK